MGAKAASPTTTKQKHESPDPVYPRLTPQTTVDVYATGPEGLTWRQSVDFLTTVRQYMSVFTGDLAWFIGGVCAGDLLVLHTR